MDEKNLCLLEHWKIQLFFHKLLFPLTIRLVNWLCHCRTNQFDDLPEWWSKAQKWILQIHCVTAYLLQIEVMKMAFVWFALGCGSERCRGNKNIWQEILTTVPVVNQNKIYMKCNWNITVEFACSYVSVGLLQELQKHADKANWWCQIVHNCVDIDNSQFVSYIVVIILFLVNNCKSLPICKNDHQLTCRQCSNYPITIKQLHNNLH